MGVDNDGVAGDRSSTCPLEESFMVDVSGQIRRSEIEESRVEQVYRMSAS